MEISFEILGSCCGVAEINNLRAAPTPTRALWSFCTWISEDSFIPPAFVVFSGIEVFHKELPPKPGRPDWMSLSAYDRCLVQWALDCRVGYASELAAYIKTNRLGALSRLRKTPNRQNHPDHLLAVYLWRPSPERLRAWWAEHRRPK